MSGNLPVEQLRQAYATWAESKGDSPDGFIALMDQTVVLRSVLDPYSGDPLARQHHGLDAARGFFATIVESWTMIGFPTDRLVAEGDTIVWIGRCHWRHRETGKEVSTPKIDVWRFQDGKAVEVLEMFDSLAFAQATGLR